MFIKYCAFSKILKYIPDSDLSRFPFGVSECVHNGSSNTSTTGRVQKNHNFSRKSTIFNEHPIYIHICVCNFGCKYTVCPIILVRILAVESHTSRPSSNRQTNKCSDRSMASRASRSFTKDRQAGREASPPIMNEWMTKQT